MTTQQLINNRILLEMVFIILLRFTFQEVKANFVEPIKDMSLALEHVSRPCATSTWVSCGWFGIAVGFCLFVSLFVYLFLNNVPRRTKCPGNAASVQRFPVFCSLDWAWPKPGLFPSSPARSTGVLHTSNSCGEPVGRLSKTNQLDCAFPKINEQRK